MKDLKIYLLTNEFEAEIELMTLDKEYAFSEAKKYARASGMHTYVDEYSLIEGTNYFALSDTFEFSPDNEEDQNDNYSS